MRFKLNSIINRKNQIKVFFIMLVFFCSGLAAFAEEAVVTLSVDEAVNLALKSNFSLNRTKIETQGKKREADRSWNELIPSVTVSATESRSTSITNNVPVGMDEWKLGASLNASLSLSPAIAYNIKQSIADYEAGKITLEAAKQDLELEVRKAFYQLQLLNSNVNLIKQNIETYQERYDQSSAMARVGQVSNLDALTARVELENLKPGLRSAEANYENAIDLFKKIIGIPVEQNVAIIGSLDNAVTVIDTANAERGSESYSITALRKSMEVIKAQKKSAINNTYSPSLNLSWNSNPMYDEDSWTDSTGAFTVGISFKLDNYLPWSAAKTQVDSLNDTIAIYQSNIAEAIVDSELKVRQYQRNIEQSLESIDSLNLNVELAQQTYEMYLESYSKGTADLQSVRSSGDSLLEAKNKVQEELYSLLAASLDLEKELNVPFGTLWRN